MHYTTVCLAQLLPLGAICLLVYFLLFFLLFSASFIDRADLIHEGINHIHTQQECTSPRHHLQTKWKERLKRFGNMHVKYTRCAVSLEIYSSFFPCYSRKLCLLYCRLKLSSFLNVSYSVCAYHIFVWSYMNKNTLHSIHWKINIKRSLQIKTQILLY